MIARAWASPKALSSEEGDSFIGESRSVKYPGKNLWKWQSDNRGKGSSSVCDVSIIEKKRPRTTATAGQSNYLPSRLMFF